MEKACFLFGHQDTPWELQNLLAQSVEIHYQKFCTRIFIVGSYGQFDRMAAAVLRNAKKQHPDITLLLLTPYHPYDRQIELPDGFDGSYYPSGMESVPKKFCIVKANEAAAQSCHSAICYVRHWGNARKLLEKLKKWHIPVCNLSDNIP